MRRFALAMFILLFCTFLCVCGKELKGFKIKICRQKIQAISKKCKQEFETWVKPVLHADTYLTDISPLPQVIAVVLIAMASVVILRLITQKKKFSFFEYVSVIPLGLASYFATYKKTV